MEKISNLSLSKILYNFAEDSSFKKITKIALIFFGMIAAEIFLTTLLYGITPISVFILGVLKINVICHIVKISIILSITTLFGFLEFFIFFAIFPLFKPKTKKNNINTPPLITNPKNSNVFKENAPITYKIPKGENDCKIEWNEEKGEEQAYEKSFISLTHSMGNQRTIRERLEGTSTNAIYCLAWLLGSEQGKNFMDQLFNTFIISTIAIPQFINQFHEDLIKNVKEGEIKNPINYLNAFSEKVNKSPEDLAFYFHKLQKVKENENSFKKDDLKELIKFCLNLK